MKLYIAGSSKELEVAENWINLARAAGFDITFDWPAAIRAEGGNERDVPITSEKQREYALTDIDAVIDADIVWFLGSVHASQGMHAELGAALALRVLAWPDAPLTVFSGERQSIFAHAVDEYYETHSEAFRELSKRPDVWHYSRHA